MHFPGDDELDSFPTINDLAVELRDAGADGKHVEFRSTSKGRLAGFPAWEHAERDLRHFGAADVPLGTIDDPFEDADDGWRIAIFEHRGHVYVLEGRTPTADDFPVSFRVPRDRYLQA